MNSRTLTVSLAGVAVACAGVSLITLAIISARTDSNPGLALVVSLVILLGAGSRLRRSAPSRQ